MKVWIAAAASVVVALSAAQASAAVMVTKLDGDWNDNPGRDYWWLEVEYDTDLLTPSSDLYGREWTWSAAQGTPSPIIRAKGAFYGHTPACYPWAGECEPTVSVVDQFDTTQITAFGARVSPDWWSGGDRFSIYFDGPDVSFGGGNYTYFSGLDIEDSFMVPSTQHGDYGYAWVNGTDWGNAHTHGIQHMFVRESAVTAAVPEPATWAMMILGFFGLGAVLRGRRDRAYA